MSESELECLSQIQTKLFTVEQLLGSQHSKQEQLTNDMLTFSNDVVCELRLLSLVRSSIVGDESEDIGKIIKSQTLQGLSFSALEYCPSFFDSNLLNHYMTFISFLRSNPSILSRCFYHFSVNQPKKKIYAAFSVFLTLFQQGWCVEEDSLLYETMKNFAIYQFEMEKKAAITDITGVKKEPLISASSILSHLEPLSSFVTAYLFNGASFSYLQCALSHIVSVLHSSSALRDLHTVFENDQGTIATHKYWLKIIDHAAQCIDSLISCFELLPSGVSSLFKYIRNHPDGGDGRCILLFFESFVNRALDNPSVLGLIPWHPGSSEWSPSKDISTVFRAIYCDLLPSKFFHPLKLVFDTFESFKTIDLNRFLDILTNNDSVHSVLMTEKELLNTNPNFPKELVITGKDLCILHEAALSFPISESDIEQKILDTFNRTIQRLGKVPEENELALEHFRIVLQRQKEITAAAKLIKTQSLFAISPSSSPKNSVKDPFAEYFCDIIALLPSFNEFISFLEPNNAMEFLHQMRLLSPHFMPEKSLLQADAVLFFSVQNSGKISDLLNRITVVTENRHTRAMEAADKTSALRTQHQRISSALLTVKTMRENVQSYLLYKISIALLRNDLNRVFQLSMSKSYHFLTNLDVYNQVSMQLMDFATSKTSELGLNTLHISQILRILFFQLTNHVTFQRFNLSDRTYWKRSIIIKTIIESNRESLSRALVESWSDEFELRKKYLLRASDLLGNIKSNSGVSVVLYYVIETISLVTLMTKQCKKLKFDPCILWVLVNAEVKHIYGIGKFVKHFLLGNSTVDTLLSASEIQSLGVFSSSICMLLRLCEQYDKRINGNWD